MTGTRTTAAGSAHEFEELCDWAAATAAAGVAALPDRVVRTAVTILCDDLSAMIAALDEPEVARTLQQAAASPDLDEAGARVLGIAGRRIDARRAGAANAVAANWTELDGGYRPATCHGSLYALPTALAEVEARDGTLGDLVTALVVGYEVVARVARAYRPAPPLRLHPHATLSPIGAAAALAAVRRLPQPDFATAVRIAASMSMTGPFSHATGGATARNLWVGAAVDLGHLAVDATAAGFTGADDVLDEVLGVPRTAVDPAALANGLGERYAVEDGYRKAYACCQYLHSTVEAAGRLAAEGLESTAVMGIEVATHALARGLDNRDPRTTLAARFSLPHAVSSVLVTGGTELEAFSSSSLDVEETARLRSLVEIRPWEGDLEPPFDRPSRVRVHLADGTIRESTVRSAAGGPDRPLTPEQLREKFDAITGARAPGFAAAASAMMEPSTAPETGAPLRVVLNRLLEPHESEA